MFYLCTEKPWLITRESLDENNKILAPFWVLLYVFFFSITTHLGEHIVHSEVNTSMEAGKFLVTHLRKETCRKWEATNGDTLPLCYFRSHLIIIYLTFDAFHSCKFLSYYSSELSQCMSPSIDPERYFSVRSSARESAPNMWTFFRQASPIVIACFHIRIIDFSTFYIWKQCV